MPKNAKKSTYRKFPKRKGTRKNSLLKKVNMLSKIVRSQRAEKKHLEEYATSQRSFGQVNNTVSGHDTYEITPAIASGTGGNNKVGKQVNLVSMSIRFQFYQQTNTVGNRLIHMYVIQIKGTQSFDVSEFLRYNQFFAANNAGTQIYDTNCSRNQAYYKTFRVLARRKCILRQDTASSQTTVKNYSLGLKFKKPLRLEYNNSGTTVDQDRIQLLLLADSGNKGNTLQVFTGVVTNAAFTGIAYNVNFDYYFYDA